MELLPPASSDPALLWGLVVALAVAVIVLCVRLRRLEQQVLAGVRQSSKQCDHEYEAGPHHDAGPATHQHKLLALASPRPSSRAVVSADDVHYTFECSNPTSGTHMTGVPRSLSQVLGARVSVLDFGAKGDGVTDCTNAIQQAINVARVAQHGVEIIFPNGAYLVTKTLRVTDLAAGGITFTGEGNGITEWGTAPAALTGAGACIVGRTGGVVFDCAGSQFLVFRRLAIQSNVKDANFSTCGMLFARTNASEFVQFNKIEVNNEPTHRVVESWLA